VSELPAVNPVDAVLVLLVLLAVWGGWRAGFIAAALQLIALLASAVFAYLGHAYPAAWLRAVVPKLDEVWAPPLGFLASFLLISVLLGAMARGIARAAPAHVHAHAVNRMMGVLPGLANGLINTTVVALVLLTAPLIESVSGMTRDSELVNRLAPPAEWLEGSLAPIFEPAIRRTLHAVTVPPESRISIDLRFTVADPRARPDLEAVMLEMVNDERAAHGLKPLKPDPELTEVARDHSRDMFARGYFSHVTPEGKELSHRIRQARLGYLVAGENLALAQTLPLAHQGLMHSPGHRANILRPQFGRLGVGVMDGGKRGLIITQNFRN
jgi:uncharacterized protein YkwD